MDPNLRLLLERLVLVQSLTLRKVMLLSEGDRRELVELTVYLQEAWDALAGEDTEPERDQWQRYRLPEERR